MKWTEHEIKRYGPLGMTVDDIVNQDDVSNDTKFEAIFFRFNLKQDYRSFTDTERKIRELYVAFGEVGNGGFDQYFSNSSGDCAELVLAGLMEMGADEAAAILRRAMSVFPGGIPPEDEEERLAAVEEIDDDSRQVWVECDAEFIGLQDKTTALVLEYAKKRNTEIHLP